MRRFPLITVLLGFSLALGMGMVSRADVWKIVDSKGEVQYTDRWEPGAELIKSDHPRANSASDDAKKQQDANDKVASDLAKQAATQAVQKDLQAVHADQCKKAQERYQKEIDARRIYKEGADGQRQFLSDAEADQERVQARSDMDEACGSSSSSSSS
ncbi:MAG TPA: hypothetical protein VME21_06435 [Steroidobacteraceae bacterium]|nr:hypothetical protein [Steroidobacteraceae bacterium]